MRNCTAVLLVWSALFSLACADPGERFRAANQAFQADDFEAAYSGYQKLLDDGDINADLLYNIGNASFRLSRKGEAALWYQRTLTLDPTHREARQNLRFLKRSGGFFQFDSPDHMDILNSVRRDTLLRIAALSAWITVLGIAAALILKLGVGIKTFLWFASPIAALVAITAGVGLYLKAQARSELGQMSIVTTDSGAAYTSPARGASTVIALPAGSQLALVSRRGDWDYVDIPGDIRGWVPQSSIKPLWPFELEIAD